MPSNVTGLTDIFNIANSVAKYFDRNNIRDLFEVKYVSIGDCDVTTSH
jgi:hypothetical protein